MVEKKDLIPVHVNVEITPVALEAIVENAKKIAGKNEKGYYAVDTADKVSEVITRFLIENNFEAYVKNIENFA